MTGDLQPPRPFDLIKFVREVKRYADWTDSQISALEDRLAALEEVVAARWPRRLAVRWRLGRSLRRSTLPYRWAGPDFASWRLQATSDEWVSALPETTLPDVTP